MSHISRKKVKKKVFHTIGDQFVLAVSQSGSSVSTKRFLNEFLTKTERIMLSKRLALIFMLQNHYPFSVIEKTLKMSPSTIMRFWKQTKEHKFSITTNHIIKNKKSNTMRKGFWDDLEKMLLAGMPPRGARRWEVFNRWLNK